MTPDPFLSVAFGKGYGKARLSFFSRYFSELGSIFKKALNQFVTDQADGRTDRQTDGQTDDRLTDRQTDTHTEKVTTVTISRMCAEG